MPLCSIVPRMRVKREIDRARKMRPAPGRRNLMASNFSRPAGVLTQRRNRNTASAAAASTKTR